ncbi:hypothetical protein CIPAW_11G159100 [Carya illinoinensis]|uniref:Uncharacterized protein n=1 Tax=Carya illinoinensis TaxID=32201 RepID=A0A8T1P6W1_CARIL|nr:hypothetical protein CIPAW_11G159100 [Carya illinoinensis]
MARLSSIFFISLFAFAIHLPSMDGRNILRVSIPDHQVPSLDDGIVSGALPKGLGPHSSSGEKGADHDALPIIEKLFAHHDHAMDHRILTRSVPSPTVGN